MASVVICSCAFLLVLAACHGSYETGLDLMDDAFGAGSKRTAQSSATAGTWFGPRLGRRQRRSVTMEEDLGAELADVLQGAAWALVPLNGGRRHAPPNFTPRLGRDSGEMDGDDAEQRSPPFAPRLGRRLVPFAPRLGREQH